MNKPNYLTYAELKAILTLVDKVNAWFQQSELVSTGAIDVIDSNGEKFGYLEYNGDCDSYVFYLDPES